MMKTRATSKGGGAAQARLPVPNGLRAQTLSVRGEEFVLFSWEPATRPSDALALLSEAERDVFARMTSGHPNERIARDRGTSKRTVANQVASILRKLGAASRFELMRRFPGE
jgi:DNA-binding NarL/FixJ family response regulator